MATVLSNTENGGKKKRTRGSVRNSTRLDAFVDQSGSGSADWGSCNCELIQAVVVEITALGGAVTFGLSRDLGAHSLTLMLDGQRQTLWFNGGADLSQELSNVLGTLDKIK